MERSKILEHWENAAPGWAKWEEVIADWMEPATHAMLDMAGVAPGHRVLDLACGAGSQTLSAARRVGPQGQVVASDISAHMLRYVRENARAAGFEHVSVMQGAAEELDVASESFDAVVCRLGLMLFADPAKALAAAHRALKPGGRAAVVVFTTPASNPFMARPMQVLLRHAGKEPPAPGQPGIFALGAPGAIERLMAENGFTGPEQRTLPLSLRAPSAETALAMMQEAFGAYRAVVSDSSDAVRQAAWADVAGVLQDFESESGFVAPAEVSVAAGTRAA